MQKTVKQETTSARKGSKNPKPPKVAPVAPVNYWESPEYAADLAALDAKGEEGLFVAPHLSHAARSMIALLDDEKYGGFMGSIEDYFSNNETGDCYHAHKGALRLCHALLDELEVRIAECVIREHKWVTERLQNIEGAGILAECEALASA